MITDLFHGQFKSTVNCSKCDRVSVTFDPLMTIMLPIPAKKDKISFFYLPYNIKDGYINNRVEIMMRGTDLVSQLRDTFLARHGIEQSTYTICCVNSNDVQRYFNCDN